MPLLVTDMTDAVLDCRPMFHLGKGATEMTIGLNRTNIQNEISRNLYNLPPVLNDDAIRRLTTAIAEAIEKNNIQLEVDIQRMLEERS